LRRTCPAAPDPCLTVICEFTPWLPGTPQRLSIARFHARASAIVWELSLTDQMRFFATSQSESTTTGAGASTAGATACCVAQPRDGSCAGASLGFTIRRHEAEEVDGDLVVTVVRARVRELSLVDEPAIRGCTAEVAAGDEDLAGKDIDAAIAVGRELRWAAASMHARW
jgi:hypothetical protein